MKISFIGAAGEVTGSCTIVEAAGSKILVDCGSKQGDDSPRASSAGFSFVPSEIAAVVLTHAHIDHSGMLPLLVKRGFKGKIWATDPTIELAEVLLRDSARLAAEDAAWRSRKNARRGLPAAVPPYSDADVTAAMKRFSFAKGDDRVKIAPGVHVRFRSAGHIAGSSIVELWAGEGADEVKAVFSGDLGSSDGIIDRPPAIIEQADCVIMESTYGDRMHKSLAATRAEFRSELERAIKAGGKVLIPTFAVDRAQRLLYELKLLQEDRSFPEMPPIYFDSPMGRRATAIYEKYAETLSRDIQERTRAGDSPFAPKGLVFTESADDSRAINEVDRAIVLAGSGMCTGGRIVHHLKHCLWSEKCRVFFVGYQARGTLGRRLVDGERDVRIAGDDVFVRGSLHTLGGFSAHGDRASLLDWASHFQPGTKFFVNHGERSSAEALASGLREQGFRAAVPSQGESFIVAPSKDAVAAVSVPAPSREAESADEVMELLGVITSAAESIRENISEISDMPALDRLLRSAGLVMESAATLVRRDG